MYRTKKDVDKHVADINNKIKSAKERNLKGYFIAKLYYQVGDYESARKYVSGYLAEKDSHVLAHKLYGQILEALKQTEKAVASYKTCYQLDNSQKDVLNSICSLLLQLPIEPGRTKYWIEQAEKQLPHSDVLFRLREALVSSTDGETSAEFEAMIKQELSSKPLDVNIRIRLIRYYQRAGRIKEAYEEAMRTEEKRIWPTNLAWYKTLLELLENYQVMYKGNLGRDFYGYYISALDTAITLEFIELAQYSRISELVAKMDRLLLEAAQSQVPPETSVYQHFQAQFYLHSSRLIYRKLTKDAHPGSVKEHHRTLGSTLLAAYTATGITSAAWIHLAAAEQIRRSIAGHCLLSLAERFGGLDNYRERLASNSGINAKISSLIYVSVERRNTMDNCFLTSNQFSVDILTADFPTEAALSEIDREAARHSLGNLNTLVWILLRNSAPGNVLTLQLPTISGLPETLPAPHLSVSQLDAHSFLYAATYTAGYLEERDTDFLLPPYLATNLSTPDQDTWWRLVQNSAEGSLAPADKRTLQYGIDVIRCKGLHGLDAQLTLRLGKTFEYHAIEATATAESDQHANQMVTVLEDRAATYYKAALASIEKLEAGVGIREPILRLFPAPLQAPSKADLSGMRQSATFYLAVNNMHQGNIDQALAMFKQVKTPFASFHTAEIYLKLAQEEKINQGTELGVTGVYTNYLTDARESLYLTLDRLKNEPSTHPLNATLGDVMEEVENLIHEAEGGANNVGDLTNGVQEPSGISRISAVRQLSSTPRASPRLLQHQFSEQLSSSVTANPSTPNRSLFREEAQPSPERLDAQIRQMNHQQEGLVRQLSARDQELLDSSKEAVGVAKDLLGVNKEVLLTNQQMMEVLKEVKSDVQEVRTIRTELVNLRDDLKVRMDRALDLLQKLCEKPVTATPPPSAQGASPPSETAYSLSEEEKLLLESFGLGTSSSSAAAAAAFQINLQQQQLMLAAMAAQQQPQLSVRPPPAVRPLMPGGMSPYGATAAAAAQPFIGANPGTGVYPGSMYGMPALPTVPVAVASAASPALAVISDQQPQLPTPQFTPQQQQAAAQASVIKTTPTIAAPLSGTPKSSTGSKPVESGAPSNVVISKSDKIPTVAPPVVSMSVTVPPQHRFGSLTPGNQPTTPSTPQQAGGTPQSAYRTPLATHGLGTPHSFQITLPTGCGAGSATGSPAGGVASSPFGNNEADGSPAVVITTQALLSNVSTPVYSAVTPSPTKAAGSGSKSRVASGGTPKTRQPSAGDDQPDDEYEPDVDFKPVIPLPEEVEVVTGEEDEEVLFEDRAKLFRFADETKEWKERGLGQAKILRNTATGKVRFLMRREQTFKVCANHYLHPDMKLDAMKGNAKARIWGAQDFADGESRTEKFCIKMKTEEQVAKFAEVFEKAAKEASTAATPKKADAAVVNGGGGKVEELNKPREATAEKPTAPVNFGAGGGFAFGTPKTTAASTTALSFGSASTTSAAASTAAPSFGGFTFSSTPTIAKPEDKKTEESSKPADAVKPSPFASFTFGTKVESVGKETSSAADAKSAAKLETETVSTPIFGGSTTLTFGSVSKSGAEAFKADPNFKGFSHAGSQLFASQTKKKEGGEGEGEEGGDATEEYEPDVEFAPVVPLPALIEVKTGEEDEDVLFSERSKLYRYVSESKEWKERGIGEFKILKNKENNRVRFLMRREQVHKICCNHALTNDIEIKPMATSDKAWTWTAPDFSEGEIVNEVFGLRFKTPDLANSFKKIVDKCQEDLKNNPFTTTTPAKAADKATEKAASKGPVSLADFAKSQKAASWECELCLTRTDNSKIQCMACEAAKPGHEDEVAKLKEAAKPPAAAVSFGAGGGMKFSFGAPAGAAANPTGSGFSFGAASTTASAAPTTGGFTFGTPKAADAAAETTKTPFGTQDKHDFSFGGVRTSPRKHNESTHSENEYYQEEDEGDNIYFEPVIPLPDKVEVKTGEEEEEVLYSHKAKVYRYTEGEWKERGLGDIKILKHKGSGKIRLLMRREQVLKICLNHYMTPQLVSSMKEKDTKSWTWAAQDFSDGELTSMTFALRFKTPDISAEFKSALDAAVADLGTAATTGSTTAAAGAADSKPAAAKPAAGKAASPAGASSADENLFLDKDFRPLSPLERENELSFEGLGLKLNTEEDAKDVADKIRAEKEMHILTLSANTVGIEAAKAIGEALAVRPEFRRAHWKDMFTGRMKTEIPPALINLTRGIMTAQARLVELDLSDNAFGPIGMEGLTTFMKSPSCYTLQELRLNNTGCGVTGGKLLAKTLLECYERSCAANHPLALKVFVLGRSRQENEGAKALAKVFKKMGSLEELVMPQNGIYHEGLTVLADALANNPNLRILNLNDNTFTDKGARAMAEALKKINNLEVLNLGDCLLKSAGAQLISRALKGRHPNLRELVMDSNEIRIAAGREIVAAVAGKDGLERLSVDGNWFGEDGEKTLTKLLKEAGKFEALASMEDNEEPDEDEADPVLEPETETKPAVSKSPGSIFSGSSGTGTGLFGGGGSSSTAPAKNLFGGGGSTTFGGSSTAAAASTPPTGLFGTPTTVKSTSIFGGSSSTPGGSIFGGSTGGAVGSTSSGSIFGGSGSSAAAKPSLFGGSSGGEGLFGAASSGSGTFAFGTPKSESIGAADSTTDDKAEGAASNNLFGNRVNSFSFSSLAEDGEKKGFGFGTKTEGFKFAGAGSTLFGKTSDSAKKTGGGEDDDDEEGEQEDEHDPHFEPIVELPDLVETKTGEEEEEVLFKHRAKVYRYDADNKEWKERGVGDIKILYHATRGTYRVLLRRDQVHKIACNHLISKDMSLVPLASSETAWCWFAVDHSEGCPPEGRHDQLAVRFKTKETAEDFKAKFESCQSKVGQKKAASSTTTKAKSEKEEGELVEGDTQYQGEDEEEEYYDEDENTPMFDGECKLWIKDQDGQWGQPTRVMLRIVYDDDVYGARIMARDVAHLSDEDEPDLAFHVIAIQTQLGDDLSWSALDYAGENALKKTFKVKFDDDEMTNDFKDIFAQGKEFAEQCEISEHAGGEMEDPSQFYYGVGGDE